MATCTVCPSSLPVVGGSGRCHDGRRAPAVVASWALVANGGSIQRQGIDSSCSSSSSAISGRSPTLQARSKGLPSASGMSVARRSRNVVCEVAVQIGGAHSSGEHDTETVKPGMKVRVKVPLTVYHVMKSPNLNLEGLEGEVKDILRVFKGKTISATLPIKVQFVIQVDGKDVKFFTHLKDDEFEVVA